MIIEEARVAELTAELDRHVARRDLEETMERVALTIAERDARTIAALESERAALAAKLAAVRALPAGPPSGGYYMVSMREVLAILDRDGGECSGSAKVGELDAMLAKLLDLAAWHETKAMKARQYPGVGSEDVMAKAAQVHDDAARRIREALDRDGGE